MSINGLTNDALRKNPDLRARSLTAADARFEIGAPVRGTVETAVQNNRVTNALNALVQYIPTEVVTLYVAAVSAASALEEVFPVINAATLYYSFGLLTPALVMLLYMSKLAAADLPYPPPRRWPWWQAIAATIAFMIWALAVPGNPHVASDAAAVIAGLGAVLVSTVLSIIAPIFERLSEA